MDGVLCDFKSYAEKTVGVPIAKWMNLSKVDKWKPIVDKGDFWSTMPWHTGAKELWSFIKKYNPDILSAHVEEVRILLAYQVRHYGSRKILVYQTIELI